MGLVGIVVGADIPFLSGDGEILWTIFEVGVDSPCLRKHKSGVWFLHLRLGVLLQSL